MSLFDVKNTTIENLKEEELKYTIIDKLSTHSFSELVVEEFFDYTQLFKFSKNSDLDMEKAYHHIEYSKEKQLDIIDATTKTYINGVLVDYHACLPEVNNLYTALINVNEIVKCVTLENNLKKIPTNHEYDEVVPIIFEELFINYLNANKGYNLSKLYKEYKEYRIGKLDSTHGEQKRLYVNALLLQDQLLDDYKKDPRAFIMDMCRIVKGKITFEDYLNKIQKEKKKVNCK